MANEYTSKFHHKCSNTLVLSISHMKLFKITKTLQLNLNTEFGRAGLSKTSVSRRKLSNHLSKRYLKRWDKNHPILSSYPVPGEKVSIYRRGKNRSVLLFISSRFSCKQPLRYGTLKHAVGTGSDCCHFFRNVSDVLSFS